MKVVVDTNIFVSALVFPGDRALLALHEYRGVRIISLRDYLNS